MIRYGEALRYQRKINNYSQSALAEAIGLKQPMISWWEAGKGLPNIDFCTQLADFYGITIDELIGRENKKIDVQLINQNTKQKKEKVIYEILSQLSEEDQMQAIGYMTALADKKKREDDKKSKEIADKVQAEFIEKKNNKE